ncbi:MAG TPA: hypothetical protein O0X25_04265 [Methanocorpusculum sp.]|nr:hypothetical protein [Methanocorpusculum sp.]HJJ40473.1 hypothetical protein [Methanocorpusculum sp.]HJJ49813.1 hypothetical protein [Methanocorpusculum sp.]HJJ57350.1 hypothetical protein [Methanocorpusculum sp.]
MNTETVSIKISPEEKDRLIQVWKSEPGVTSCSQYIRQAIEEKSGGSVFVKGGIRE